MSKSIVIKVSQREADLLWSSNDGMLGCIENPSLEKLLRKINKQIEEQTEGKADGKLHEGK